MNKRRKKLFLLLRQVDIDIGETGKRAIERANCNTRPGLISFANHLIDADIVGVGCLWWVS
jgi:hypothetical protein